MPSERKLAKQEAKRQKILKEYEEHEETILDKLDDRYAQYYSMDNISINFHKTGLYNDQYLEGYLIFPDPVPKEERMCMQAELIETITSKNLSLRELINYVVGEKSQDYWALLFWYTSVFVKQIKKNGSWNKDDEFKLLDFSLDKNICKWAERYRFHTARDLVQFVFHEHSRFDDYDHLVVFRDSSYISSCLDLTKVENYGCIYTQGKEKFKLKEFSDAKKYCL